MVIKWDLCIGSLGEKSFQELKILPLLSHHVSLYYYSLLIIGIILFKIVYNITMIPDKEIMYTCLWEL